MYYKPSGLAIWYEIESLLRKLKYKFVEWGWQFWTLQEKLEKGRIPFQICFAKRFQQQMDDMEMENEVEFQMNEEEDVNAFNIENTEMDEFYAHFDKLNHLSDLARKYRERRQ